jgi:hypothetical protein
MKHWWMYSCMGAVWQSAMLVAFTLVCKTSWDVPGKYVVLGLFYLGAGLMLAIAGRRLTVGQLALMAVGISTGSTVVETILGFTIWPGLVKDLGFWSIDNLRGFVQWAVFLFVVYWACTMAFWAVWKLAGRAHWGKTAIQN